jgi:hypothetical protein
MTMMINNEDGENIGEVVVMTFSCAAENKEKYERSCELVASQPDLDLSVATVPG